MELVGSEIFYSTCIPNNSDIKALRENAPYRYYDQPCGNIVLYDKPLDRIVYNPIITRVEEIKSNLSSLEELIANSDVIISSGSVFAIDIKQLLFVSNITTRTNYCFFSKYIPSKADSVLALNKNGQILRIPCLGGRVPYILRYEEISKGFIQPLQVGKKATTVAVDLYVYQQGLVLSSYYLDQFMSTPERLSISPFKLEGITTRLKQIKDKIILPAESNSDETFSLLELTNMEKFPEVEKETDVEIDFTDDLVKINRATLCPRGVLRLVVDEIPSINWVKSNFLSDDVYFVLAIGG